MPSERAWICASSGATPLSAPSPSPGETAAAAACACASAACSAASRWAASAARAFACRDNGRGVVRGRWNQLGAWRLHWEVQRKGCQGSAAAVHASDEQAAATAAAARSRQRSSYVDSIAISVRQSKHNGQHNSIAADSCSIRYRSSSAPAAAGTAR